MRVTDHCRGFLACENGREGTCYTARTSACVVRDGFLAYRSCWPGWQVGAAPSCHPTLPKACPRPFVGPSEQIRFLAVFCARCLILETPCYPARSRRPCIADARNMDISFSNQRPIQFTPLPGISQGLGRSSPNVMDPIFLTVKP